MKRNILILAVVALFVSMSAFKCGGSSGGGTGGSSPDTAVVTPR